MSNDNLPAWAKDPDADLKRQAMREREWRPIINGLGLVVTLLVLLVASIFDWAAWLGGLRAMGWVE